MNKRDEKFLIKNSRGLSDIVITLIIILLAMVGIGAVWFVVNGLLQSGTAGIASSAACLALNMEIRQVKCANGTVNQTCNVTIARTGTESEPIGGVKMVFFDEDTQISSSLIDVSGNIEPLVGKRLTNFDAMIANENVPDLIQITPYFTDDSGNQQLCSQTTSFEF